MELQRTCRSLLRASLAVVAVTALSCGDDLTGISATGDDTTGTGTETDGEPQADGLDILFVVDNSGSAYGIMSQFVPGIGDAINVLEAANINYRVAVTTTDMGNPLCAASGFPAPTAGKLVLESCLDRLGAFEFMPEDIDGRAMCTDHCKHAGIETTPTSVEGDEDGPSSRPWIERIDGQSNIDLPMAEALICTLPQGINGCGYESPLDSMLRALERTQMKNDPNFGFLREDADLLIVMISDEVDCSVNTSYNHIFIDAGVNTFWEPGAEKPTNAICWNAGVSCEGDAPGPYASCSATNYGLDGTPGVSDGEAVINPLSRYTNAMKSLEKLKTGARVQMASISGVPPGYSTGTASIVFEDNVDPTEQINYGIAPGCVSDLVEARPPVRVREVVEDVGGPGVYSACRDDYGPMLADIMSRAIARE